MAKPLPFYNGRKMSTAGTADPSGFSVIDNRHGELFYLELPQTALLTTLFSAQMPVGLSWRGRIRYIICYSRRLSSDLAIPSLLPLDQIVSDVTSSNKHWSQCVSKRLRDADFLISGSPIILIVHLKWIMLNGIDRWVNDNDEPGDRPAQRLALIVRRYMTQTILRRYKLRVYGPVW